MLQREAIDAARRILREEGYGIPVDVEGIARARNVTVVRQELDDSVSGVLVVKAGHGIIGVNDRHHPNRQRFTIAHELAHYLLHQECSDLFVDRSPVFFRDETSSGGVKQQEIAANAFAAELLMPREELKERLNERPIDALDDMSIRRLAARFGVSAQALTIRLTRLGLVPDWVSGEAG